MDLSELGTSEPSAFSRFLEKVVMVLALAAAAVLVLWFLRIVWKKLRRGLKKLLALVGQGMAETTLRQTAPHRVMTVKDGSRVEGLAITGGRTTSNWTHGAGAYVADGTISRCHVHHNQAKGNNVYGVGVFFEKGSIDHSVISFNTGTNTGAGGGIGHYNTAGTILVEECLVSGNVRTNGRGGGLCFVMNNPNVTIRNTTITGNFASLTGGGLSDETYNHTVKLVNCTVSGNTDGSSTP